MVQLTIFAGNTYRYTGHKPLSEPIMALFINTYKRHSASIN